MAHILYLFPHDMKSEVGHTVSVLLSHLPDKKQLEGVYLGLPLQGKWSIVWRRHGARSVRQLVTLHPQSESREMNATGQFDAV